MMRLSSRTGEVKETGILMEFVEGGAAAPLDIRGGKDGDAVIG